MKSELVSRAKMVGFDICHVTTSEAPPHLDEFRNWLSDGQHATMDWLVRGQEKRSDLNLILPGVKSVIVLATNYFQNYDNSSRHGRIAKYALGQDYHDVIEPKLEDLVDFLHSRGGIQKAYTDTGPVLERDLAARAGIGWQGKSTMLLNPELGTWFFLSVILTTLEIEPDSPARNHCGNCSRCMTACPTGAITSAYHLDARRCISYLTIENKGSIPLEFRRAMGDRIYGCDDCLTACPWNRFAKESSQVSFLASPVIRETELRSYLSWTDEQFRTRFRGSPIKRIKRRGFLRNVCVALGNVGSREDLPALRLATNDLEPLIAEHAAWAIAEIESRLD